MNENPITIIIDNYNNKKIIFTMPSDTKIEMLRQANFAEILSGSNTFSNLELIVNGEGIVMDVEHLN